MVMTMALIMLVTMVMMLVFATRVIVVMLFVTVLDSMSMFILVFVTFYCAHVATPVLGLYPKLLCCRAYMGKFNGYELSLSCFDTGKAIFL